MSPRVSAARLEHRDAAGGVRPGSETKWSELGGLGGRDVQDRRDRAPSGATREREADRAPGRAAGRRRAPARPAVSGVVEDEARAARAASTGAGGRCGRRSWRRRRSTEPMRAGATPRMLICVCGEASGVPGAGEIVSRPAAPAGAGTAAWPRGGDGGDHGGGRAGHARDLPEWGHGLPGSGRDLRDEVTGTPFHQLLERTSTRTPRPCARARRRRRRPADAGSTPTNAAGTSSRPRACSSRSGPTRPSRRADVADAAGVARSLVHHYFGGIARACSWPSSRRAARRSPTCARRAPETPFEQRIAHNVAAGLDVVADNRETWLAAIGRAGGLADPELRRDHRGGHHRSVERALR